MLNLRCDRGQLPAPKRASEELDVTQEELDAFFSEVRLDIQTFEHLDRTSSACQHGHMAYGCYPSHARVALVAPYTHKIGWAPVATHPA